MSGWRRMLHVLALAGCATIAGAPRASETHHEPPAHARLQHALGILEYVGGDYEGAVDARGRIRHELEYAEQKDLLRRAEKLLIDSVPRGHQELIIEMRAVRAACEARVAPSKFVARLRRLHTKIVQDLDVELTPQFVPSLAVGRIVYAQSCVACHGEDGSARTTVAAGLDPRPLPFRDAQLTERLSPFLAFSMVTFGVPGTAMASFELLAEDERWAVAFYVMALRHERPDGLAAVAAHTTSGDSQSLTLRDLALATDAELAFQHFAHLPPAERADAIARARWSLPLETGK